MCADRVFRAVKFRRLGLPTLILSISLVRGPGAGGERSGCSPLACSASSGWVHLIGLVAPEEIG
jgi:hypothetical protein